MQFTDYFNALFENKNKKKVIKIRYHLKSGKTLDIDVFEHDTFLDFANYIIDYDYDIGKNFAVQMSEVEYFEEIKDGD